MTFFSPLSNNLGDNNHNIKRQKVGTLMCPQLVFDAARVLNSFGCGTSSMTLDDIGADKCANYVEDIVTSALGVPIDSKLVCELMAPIVSSVGASYFVANAFARCKLMRECLGDTLFEQLKIATHCQHWYPSNAQYVCF